MENNPFNPFLEKLKEMPKPPKPVSLEELELMKCTKCNNNLFDRYFKMYKLDASKTASKKEQHFNVPVYVCASCSCILELKETNLTKEEKND